MALRVAVATNVPPPVLRAYLSPLLQVAEVSEVVLIRDIANVDSAPKLRVVTPPAWWPRLLPMKIAARQFSERISHPCCRSPRSRKWSSFEISRPAAGVRDTL